MKTMFTSMLLGSVLLALGLVIKAGTLTISADRLAFGLASIIFVVGGLAGFIFVWQNRPISLRRNVRSRR